MNNNDYNDLSKEDLIKACLYKDGEYANLMTVFAEAEKRFAKIDLMNRKDFDRKNTAITLSALRGALHTAYETSESKEELFVWMNDVLAVWIGAYLANNNNNHNLHLITTV